MPSFTSKDLKKDISSGNFSRIYFMYGDEKYSINAYEKAIINKIFGGQNPGMNLSIFDGRCLQNYKLSLALESFPVASRERCVVIHNLNIDSMKSDETEELYDIISDIPEFSILIISQLDIYIDIKKSSKWKKFNSHIDKYGKCVVFQKTTRASGEKQIIKWCKERGKSISSENAMFLIDRCGRDLNTIKNESDKLCALEQSEEISIDTIMSITIPNLEADVFEMCKLLINGEYKKACNYIDILFSRKEQPIAILAAIASNFIDMYRVKVVQNSGNDFKNLLDIADYKGKEFKLDIARRNSKSMDIDTIRKIILLLTESDFKLKSNGFNARTVMDEIVIKVKVLREKGVSIDKS